MFGKVMSISDELMWRYYELLTDLRVEEIKALRASAESGERNPRDIKVELAKRIITDFHSAEDAQAAEAEFNRMFREKQAPSEIEELTLSVGEGKWVLPHLLVETGLVTSNAEARRLISQGGIKLDEARVETPNFILTGIKPGMTFLLQVGKRRFMRVRFE
jgi:tyrosyl-tRNA synthetase